MKILFALLASIAFTIQAEDLPPTLDVPQEVPLTSTSTIICTDHGDQLMSLIVTFADGKVLRIDNGQMHGFTTPEQILSYGNLAKDTFGYYMKCKGQIKT